LSTVQAPLQRLELLKEAKIFDILGGRLDPRLEASGVLANDGLFYVIFDARSAGTGSARSSCRRPFCSGTTVA
jgi:hypothetical protein